MVIYPRACIGCGETDAQKLKEFPYTFKHRHFVSSRSVGYNQIETTYNVHSLPVNTFLCAPCERKAKIRYILGVVLFLLLMVGGWVGFGVAADEGELEVLMALIPVVFVFSFTIFMWIGWRRHPETHFHKVRYNYRRGIFRFIFKNVKFADIFKQANSAEQIKVKKHFP